MLREIVTRTNIKALLGFDIFLLAVVIIAGIFTDMSLFLTALLCGVIWLDGLFGIILWMKYSGDYSNKNANESSEDSEDREK